MPLHTNAFTHRQLYTDAFTHRHFLHTNAFTRKRFYTHGRINAEMPLHTDALTHRPFTHRRLCTHTHKGFYTHLLRTILPNCEVGINRAREKQLSKNEWEKEVRQGLNAPCPWRKIQNVATCNCCWKLILPKSVTENQLQIPANAQIAH